MNVLVACEESQRVCMAFRERGHNAYSCDIQEPSGGHPEWHLKADVLRYLNPVPEIEGILPFLTMDGESHFIAGKWDLIIAHPPCTYLSAAGAVRLYNSEHEIKDHDRYTKGLDASDFFMTFLNSECDRVCVENPVPLRIFELPKYSQIIQPYYFGDPWNKKTCLWLKGLPHLTPTNVVPPKDTG